MRMSTTHDMDFPQASVLFEVAHLYCAAVMLRGTESVQFEDLTSRSGILIPHTSSGSELPSVVMNNFERKYTISSDIISSFATNPKP